MDGWKEKINITRQYKNKRKENNGCKLCYIKKDFIKGKMVLYVGKKHEPIFDITDGVHLSIVKEEEIQ